MYQLDVGEANLGKRAENFEVDDFIPYTVKMCKEEGFKYVPNRVRDKAIYRWLYKTYGGKVAGSLIRYAFHRYHGIIDGEQYSPNHFCVNRKWFVDKMIQEMENFKKPKVSDDSGINGMELMRSVGS